MINKTKLIDYQLSAYGHFIQKPVKNGHEGLRSGFIYLLKKENRKIINFRIRQFIGQIKNQIVKPLASPKKILAKKGIFESR